MSREIKFRGFEPNGNQWCYGDLIHYGKYVNIRGFKEVELTRPLEFIVIPESVGQFTGLHDKNGKEIYEGDILKSEFISSNFGIEWNSEVCCHDYYVITEDQKTGDALARSIEEAPMKTGKNFTEIIEVIGNIYENPDLL
jgi:uncharacterized phage protein (TIGR01671 family)